MNIKLLVILIFINANGYTKEYYQLVNPNYKLLKIAIGFEASSSGEEKLYEYESPYGHFYSPQGWGHQEEITLDLRRIKFNFLFMEYVPLYFSGSFKTFPYIPYADSLQIIKGNIGLMLPLFTVFNSSLYYNFEGSAQTWSGHQVAMFENKLILQSDFGLENQKYPLHIFNISLNLERNSGIPLIKFIDKDSNKFGYDSALRGDITVDTRPFGWSIFCGYKFQYTWIWNTPSNNRKTFLQTIFLGHEIEISKDLGLELQGNFDWRDNVRVFRSTAQLVLRTNLQ